MATDGTDFLNLCGYVYNPQQIEAMASLQPNPVLMATSLGLQDSGKGKDVFLFEIERKFTGKVRPPHNQTIGDCVSHGVTGAAEDLQFVMMLKDPSIQFQWLSSEVTYALARIEIGRGGCGYGDGAVVGWGLEAGKSFGFVNRAVYGQYDLTTYSGQRAKQWGAPRAGCPAELEEIAKKHPIQAMSLIEGPDYYTQCRDVIASGGVIVTGSNQLFRANRDATGFCKPGGSGGHCTYFRAVTDNDKRPGIGYQQSWGPNVPSGGSTKVTLPHGREVELPEGFFFVDADDFNNMHRRGAEVWAITSQLNWSKPDSDIDFVFYN